MFHLQAVSKTYRRHKSTVCGFSTPSLQIGTGDYIALVGPSGSGKTTLLSILGGMLSPDSGRVSFDEVSLYDLSIEERARWRREKVGFVFQTFNLIPYLSALENVCVPLYLSGRDRGFQTETANQLLCKLGLGDRVLHKPCELSTGQQQRVALARTIANEPKVILADEPTGNLDPGSREAVLNLFDEFVQEGRTVVMVTHDVLSAKRARRVVHLVDGLIVDSELKIHEAA